MKKINKCFHKYFPMIAFFLTVALLVFLAIAGKGGWKELGQREKDLISVAVLICALSMAVYEMAPNYLTGKPFEELPPRGRMVAHITDGHGNFWPEKCPNCGADRYVKAVGEIGCKHCENDEYQKYLRGESLDPRD